MEQTKLAELRRFRPMGPATDPIWMEYVLEEIELEAGLKRQLVASQFEALAAVHETWANQAKQAAELLAKGR